MHEQENKTILVTAERPDGALFSSRAADTIVVKVAGELGLSAMSGAAGEFTGIDGDTALDHALLEAVPKPPGLVVMDLSGVTYLSSLGMGALLRFQSRLNESGSILHLAGANKLVAGLIQRVGLNTAFKLFPDVSSAMK